MTPSLLTSRFKYNLQTFLHSLGEISTQTSSNTAYRVFIKSVAFKDYSNILINHLAHEKVRDMSKCRKNNERIYVCYGDKVIEN
jgi:hypothetical protein